MLDKRKEEREKKKSNYDSLARSLAHSLMVSLTKVGKMCQSGIEFQRVVAAPQLPVDGPQQCQ